MDSGQEGWEEESLLVSLLIRPIAAAGKADVEYLSNNVRDVIALFAAPFG